LDSGVFPERQITNKRRMPSTKPAQVTEMRRGARKGKRQAHSQVDTKRDWQEKKVEGRREERQLRDTQTKEKITESEQRKDTEQRKKDKARKTR
jgi:hypothetical protein